MNHSDCVVEMKILADTIFMAGDLVIVLTIHSSSMVAFFYSNLVPLLLQCAALQMSVQDNAKEVSNQNDVNKVLGDESFVSSILASVYVLNWTDRHFLMVHSFFTVLNDMHYWAYSFLVLILMTPL